MEFKLLVRDKASAVFDKIGEEVRRRFPPPPPDPQAIADAIREYQRRNGPIR